MPTYSGRMNMDLFFGGENFGNPVSQMVVVEIWGFENVVVTVWEKYHTLIIDEEKLSLYKFTLYVFFVGS